MIASMTAFSRLQSNHIWGSLVLEIRSVNSRYLDISFKLPESLRELEILWREEIKKQLSRGKVECHLQLQIQAQKQPELTIDHALLDQIMTATTEVQSSLRTKTPVNPLELLRWPGILCTPKLENHELKSEASSLLRRSLFSLIETRDREGSKLMDVISKRVIGIDKIIGNIRNKLPVILEEQRMRLLARLEDLKPEVDQQRLAQEVVYIAQKIDVDEELDRLATHVIEIKRTLSKGGACGRRLDFLAQELNREANTLASKSVSSETTQNAVELKVLIEQIREQIQNIE